MTKFSELDSEKQAAISAMLLKAYERRVQDDVDYMKRLYQMPIAANGAGVALLLAYISGIAGEHAIAALSAPLWKFVVGVAIGAAIYIPASAVASDAVGHVERELQEFYLDKKDLESIQGYGLNSAGRILVNGLFFCAIAFFIWGTAQSIGLIKAIAGAA